MEDKKLIRFRIVTNDVKVVPIDRDVNAVVGTMPKNDAKTLVLSMITSKKFNKAMIKTIAYVMVRTFPFLWDYLSEVREKLDNKGVE